MAEILTSYYENRAALENAGKWCYKRVHEKPFTWPYVQKQMLDMVKTMLEKPAASSEFKGFGTPAKIN
jgi:hypothetical protein